MIRLRIAPLLFALCIVPCWITESSQVVLEGNAFKNVLVAFSPSLVDTNEQKSVLSSAKIILKEASSTLHTATGLYFGNVIFLIPRSWGSGWAEESPASPSMGDLGDAVFQVESAKESVFGTEPFTTQHGGCGESGLRITIPTEFLLKRDTDADQSETYKKAQLIVREWVRYRYGVFDEGGFPGDERYPLYYSVPGSDGSDVRVTECTHQQAKYIFRDGGGNECTPAVDKDSGFPKSDSGCSIHPEEEGKENITSSLMYRFQVPNMRRFCDDQDEQHNSHALNKQNVLCKTRSVGNVMNSHPDFKEKKLASTEEVSPDPEIQYVQNQAAKIVIAVDQNAEFQKESGFLIKNAVIKFILELPEETKCGFIKFNDATAIRTMNLTSLTSNRAAQITKVNPTFIRKDKTSCSTCALLEALVMLEQDLPQSRSAIILVATSNVTANDELRFKIQNLQVCLVIIFFTGFEATADGFNDLLELSPCARVWEIKSDRKLEDILFQMYDIFTSVIHRYEEEIRITTLTTASLSAGSKVTFDTDSTVEGLTVWVTSVETNSASLSTKIPIENIVLQRNGEIWAENAEEIPNMPSFVFFRQNASNSYWTCKFVEEFDISLLVSVTASSQREKLISSRVWIKDNTDKSENPHQQQPVILYTQLSVGVHPVVNAKVIATVNPPGGEPAATFHLFDNGVGDVVFENSFALQEDEIAYDRLMHYILHPQAKCNFPISLGGKIDTERRIDGDKVMCLDPGAKLHKGCTVYSFGINSEWSFDEAIQREFGCNVFAFDPSMTSGDQMHSKGVWFYRSGIADFNGDLQVGKQLWKMKTFESILDSLGHKNTTIDVLKMDIEGAEYSVIEDMLRKGMLKKVKHLCVEIHLMDMPYWNRVYRMLKMIEDEAGLHHFHTSNNTKMPFMRVPGIYRRYEQHFFEMAWYR